MAARTRENLLLPGIERWPLDPQRPVIQLEDVSVSFGENQVLQGLSLDIPPGKTTVIAGRSGSGKTVLLKLMMGILKPDSGTVRLFGKDVTQVTDLELIDLRKRMSMLFQSYALLDSLTVADNIGFPLLENSRLPQAEIARHVEALLQLLGLPGTGHLLPASLSGGMRKRVSLGRALIANPEVVLFDEPTTGLDPIMVEKVDELILLARKEFEITSVIISHDLASMKRLADRVAFLHDGRILSCGTYQELLESREPAIQDFLDGARTTRLSRASGGEAAGPGSRQAADEPVVELIDVHKSFDENYVLRGVNLKIIPNKITVLIGGSGSGKSVIVRHIMGLFRPDSGHIKVFGKELTTMNEQEMVATRRRFGMLFQHAALLDWMTVYENVAFPLVEHSDLSKSEIRDRVMDLLERVHIMDVKDKLPGEISAGQKKRVGLARAIITQPDVMIYDEPTTGQDPVRTRQVDDMIQEAQREFQITSIVISHDMASTFRVADRIAFLHQGRIAAYGTPAEVRASQDEDVQRFIYAGTV